MGVYLCACLSTYNTGDRWVCTCVHAYQPIIQEIDGVCTCVHAYQPIIQEIDGVCTCVHAYQPIIQAIDGCVPVCCFCQQSWLSGLST